MPSNCRPTSQTTILAIHSVWSRLCLSSFLDARISGSSCFPSGTVIRWFLCGWVNGQVRWILHLQDRFAVLKCLAVKPGQCVTQTRWKAVSKILDQKEPAEISLSWVWSLQETGVLFVCDVCGSSRSHFHACTKSCDQSCGHWVSSLGLGDLDLWDHSRKNILSDYGNGELQFLWAESVLPAPCFTVGSVENWRQPTPQHVKSDWQQLPEMTPASRHHSSSLKETYRRISNLQHSVSPNCLHVMSCCKINFATRVVTNLCRSQNSLLCSKDRRFANRNQYDPQNDWGNCFWVVWTAEGPFVVFFGGKKVCSGGSALCFLLFESNSNKRAKLATQISSNHPEAREPIFFSRK